MNSVELVESAIQQVINGSRTQYINFGEKTVRVSNHGANPERTDENTISIVIGNEEQSYRSDRGRTVTNWERSNQWYMTTDGSFVEQFDSVESFLNWFEI